MRSLGAAGRVFVPAALLVAAATAQPPTMKPDSRRECAVCHLKWIDAFERPQAVVLIEQPDDSVAAEAKTCLGCHDGSVGDSRRLVWLEHGHRTGVVPPATMRVPAQLPLEDGKLTCRTCHGAHAAAGGESLASAFFLRVPNEASQLCQMCHPEYTKGPELGTHPIGGMPWPVPDELIAAGARLGPTRDHLICQTCHTAHGAREEHLLVMGTQSGQLCQTCHNKLRPGLWRADVSREHPQNPPLSSDAQRQAIRDMATKTGPGETLFCLSCHKLHHGLAGRDMLADTLADSSLCLRCHPEHRNVFNSVHDLRGSAPNERNRLGLTAEQSGPCGACHSFHQFARQPGPLEADPTGLCTTCHQPGQCASQTTGMPFSHPTDISKKLLPPSADLILYADSDDPDATRLACVTCHDPHETQRPRFLRDKPDKLCAQCHPNEAGTLAGQHDFRSQLETQNGRDLTASETGKCGFCHAVHNANGPMMWTATKGIPGNADDLCIQCHQTGGLASAKPATALRHPTGPRTTEMHVALADALPLFDASGHRKRDGLVACSSCHDPHADPDKTPKLLRSGPPVSMLCTSCHPRQALLAEGLHDPNLPSDVWPEAARAKADVCMACHQAHSNDPARGLWTTLPLAGYARSDSAFLACHQDTAWAERETAAKPGAAVHPRTFPEGSSLSKSASGLPLLATGTAETVDVIGCKTCHDPHAGPDGLPHMLRKGTDSGVSGVCMECHQDVRYIATSLHSQQALREYADTTQVCGPCHVVHAKSATATATMWAGPEGPAEQPPGTRRCLGCHGPEGNTTPIMPVAHPPAALENTAAAGTPGFMPLVDAQGAIAHRGRIACITCHMPHGRSPDDGFPAIEPGVVTRQQVRAMMPMLRPYVAPNLCSTCHGFDSLRRYLYFHDPDKGGGGLAPPNASTPPDASDSSDLTTQPSLIAHIHQRQAEAAPLREAAP